MKNKIKKIVDILKKNKIKSIVASIIILVMILGISFAVFMVMDESGEKEITYGNLDIEYIDGKTIKATGQLPLTDEEIEEYASKTNFTVKNTGDIPVYLEISLTNITMDDELKTSDFRYALYQEETKVATGTFEDCEQSLVLGNNVLQDIDSQSTNYTIALWIQDNGGNQNAMLNKNMSAKIKVVATDKVYYSNLLPSEYQQVEYIESTGTQYIDTGVIPNKTTNMKLDINILSTSSSITPIIGARTESFPSLTYFITANNEFYMSYNSADTDKTTINLNERIILSNTSNELYVNNTKVATGITGDFDITTTIILLGLNTSNGVDGRHLSAKVYGLKIYSEDVLIRDYIPCYRKSDNVVGLYDLVENKFYTNNGTGTFLKGNNI